jgi:hypothetical protein
MGKYYGKYNLLYYSILMGKYLASKKATQSKKNKTRTRKTKRSRNTSTKTKKMQRRNLHRTRTRSAMSRFYVRGGASVSDK